MMLVDIPDVGTIIGIFITFVLGVFAIIIYNKIKPLIRTRMDLLNSYTERLQYYENQLIDMKIRLDSVELLKEICRPSLLPTISPIRARPSWGLLKLPPNNRFNSLITIKLEKGPI